MLISVITFSKLLSLFVFSVNSFRFMWLKILYDIFEEAVSQ